MVKNRSARHYTDNYYQAVCCFAHTAPLLLTLRALPALHVVPPMRPLHPMHQVPKGRISDRTLTAPPEVARRLQPMHRVHQCSRFTTTVRDQVGTACALCGKPITNSPTGRPRTYCSDACRQKAYRNRLLLRNPLSRALEGVSLQLSAIRDPDTAHSAISDPAAANEFTWQACTGDSRA